MRILIVDKREIFREGLARLLLSQPGIEVARGCALNDGCIEKAKLLLPDVIIIDVELKGDSTEMVLGLLEIRPEAKVLVLTHSEKSSDLFATLKAGASGYLTKDVSTNDLMKAISIISEGGIIISPPMASKMLREFTVPGPEGQALSTEHELELSNREEEVLGLISKGATNKTIAESLFIAENTVKVHLRNIMEKLHVKSRLQVALMARERNSKEPAT